MRAPLNSIHALSARLTETLNPASRRDDRARLLPLSTEVGWTSLAFKEVMLLQLVPILRIMIGACDIIPKKLHRLQLTKIQF